MAFSTQKEFFNVPFFDESYEFECIDKCLKLKSYGSTIDDRSWAAGDSLQSKFLSDLVTCNTVAGGAQGRGAPTDCSASDSRGRARQAASRSQVGSTTSAASRSQSQYGRSGIAGLPNDMVVGDSLLELANENLRKYEKLLKDKDSQLEASRECLKTANEENQKIKQILGQQFDCNSIKELKNILRQLSCKGALEKSEENQINNLLKQLESLGKHIEVVKAENTFLKRLVQKLQCRIGIDDITVDKETCNDVAELQEKINRMQKELCLLRKYETEAMKCKTFDNQNDDYTKHIQVIVQERNELRKRCERLKGIEHKFNEVQHVAKDYESKCGSLAQNLDSQTKYLNDVEQQMKKMCDYYEEKLLKEKCCETDYKCQVEALKEELNKQRSQSEESDCLKSELQCLRDEIMKRDIAINDYECQYKQLMNVVEELKRYGACMLPPKESCCQCCQTDDNICDICDECYGPDSKGRGDCNQKEKCKCEDDYLPQRGACINELSKCVKVTIGHIQKELTALCMDRDKKMLRLARLAVKSSGGCLGPPESLTMCDIIKEFERLICETICKSEKITTLEKSKTTLLEELELLEEEKGKSFDKLLEHLDEIKGEIDDYDKKDGDVKDDLQKSLSIIREINEVQLQNQKITEQVVSLTPSVDANLLDELSDLLEAERSKNRSIEQLIGKIQEENKELKDQPPKVEVVEIEKEVVKEVPMEVIKEVEIPVEVVKEVKVEVPVEVPIEVVKEVEVPVEVIKEVKVEVPVEVPVEVVKEVEVPVPVPVEVVKEVVKEVPVEVIKEVPVDRPVEVIKEVKVEVPVEVVKEVKVPVEVIKEVQVDRPVEVLKEVKVEVPVEVIKEVNVDRPVEVIKEVNVEVPVEVIKTVEVIKEVKVEVPVEVIKEVEVPVEVPVEVVKKVEVPVPVPMEVVKEVVKEVPVEVIKEVPVDRPVEVMKEVKVEVPVEVVKEVKVPVEVVKEVKVDRPVEVLKEVKVEVPVEVIKEVNVDRPVEVIKEVNVEVPVEVIKTVEVIKEVKVEVPVEVIKEVKVEVPVEVIKTVEVIKEVKVEVPVEVIKEVRVEVPVEVIKEVYIPAPPAAGDKGAPSGTGGGGAAKADGERGGPSGTGDGGPSGTGDGGPSGTGDGGPSRTGDGGPSGTGGDDGGPSGTGGDDGGPSGTGGDDGGPGGGRDRFGGSNVRFGGAPRDSTSGRGGRGGPAGGGTGRGGTGGAGRGGAGAGRPGKKSSLSFTPENDNTIDEFVNKTVLDLCAKRKRQAKMDEELRQVLDDFIQECGFCFCKSNIPKNRFYQICHKLYHDGLESLSFKELCKLHKKIYCRAETLNPGYLLKKITTDIGCNVEKEPQMCCVCQGEVCCKYSEEKLCERITQLESDIKGARDQLDKLKEGKSSARVFSARLDEDWDGDSTFRASSKSKCNNKEMKNIKARILKCSKMLR